MTIPSEYCQEDARRDAVRARPNLIGLDYLEVSDNQLTLSVYFLGKAPAQLIKRHGEDTSSYKKRLKKAVRIEGGERIQGIQVVEVRIIQAVHPRTGKIDPDLDDSMEVRLDRFGDFSTYRLRLVGLDEITDPFYDHLDFSFKVDCPSDLDCASEDTCPPPVFEEPEINYLAKDYASFRQLILDRLALIMPDWRERHVPDLGITLVEILAYTGDQLSYYQDAVATEAYLETARQRISIRRHARLVDYKMHEGCNARAWVQLETDTDLVGADGLDPSSLFLITGFEGLGFDPGTILNPNDLITTPPSQYEVYEPVEARVIELRRAHNRLCFYSWGNRHCCLPQGTVRATLKDSCGQPAEHNRPDRRQSQAKQTAETAAQAAYEYQTRLQPGDVLIFEETMGPKTGVPEDADPHHRHAVRLTRVTYTYDQLYGPPVPIVEIEWDVEDALPFPLCISAVSDADHQCVYLEDISVAYGNVILVDHGLTVGYEDLGGAACLSAQAECDCEGRLKDTSFEAGAFQPELVRSPLTYRAAYPQPGVTASQQARVLGEVLANVHAGAWALYQKTQNGQPLVEEDFYELLTIYGYAAMHSVRAIIQNGQGWLLMEPPDQAESIAEILKNEDGWLAEKARRIEMLRARALDGQVLVDAQVEIAALFGEKYAAGLEPGSPQTLGPASTATLQDPRSALPQVTQLSSIQPAPAASCDTLGPLFTFEEYFFLPALISRLRESTSLATRTLLGLLSRQTLDLLAQPDEGGEPSPELTQALSGDLKRLLKAWEAVYDLLDSQPGDLHFVVEIDDDQRAHLRFGDGATGSKPEAGSQFFGRYRVGNGRRGNVGAEAIAFLVSRTGGLNGVRIGARNPLPAQGGLDPEAMIEVKLFAPTAFRKEIQRAVTADDYAVLAQREFASQIQRAAASLVWTGSWYEAAVAVDPLGSEAGTPDLLSGIYRRLGTYRRMGHDLAVDPAHYVPLDIALEVCVLPNYLRAHVEAELLDVFSKRVLAGGRRGYFHPDNLTFGQNIYLSRLVAAAQAVTGVESVRVARLQRLFESQNHEIENGVLKLGPLEVARVDNDPNYPEHGQLQLSMGGGR